PFTLPAQYSRAECDRRRGDIDLEVRRWLRDSALPNHSFAGYDGLVIVIPLNREVGASVGCTFAGTAFGATMISQGIPWWWTSVHEIGHLMGGPGDVQGLQHGPRYRCTRNGMPIVLATAAECTEALVPEGWPDFDGYDAMSSGPYLFHAVHKYRLGIMPETNVRTVTDTTTVTLTNSESVIRGATQLIRIPWERFPDGTFRTAVYLELRKRQGKFDDSLPDAAVNGISVRYGAYDGGAPGHTGVVNLLDGNPRSATFDDAQLTPGQSFSNALRQTFVRVNSIDTAAGTASLTITRGTPQTTVRVVDGRLEYSATANTASNVRFESAPGGAVDVTDSLFLAEADSSCSPLGDNRVRCANVTSIAATLGDKNDTATVAVDLPSSLDGGSGNDGLSGGPGLDTFDGGPGDDTISSKDGRVETVTCGDGILDEVAGDVAPGVTMENMTACEWVHDGDFSVARPALSPLAFGGDVYSNNNLGRVHGVYTLTDKSVGYRRNSCFVVTGTWCAMTSLGGYATTSPTVVEAGNRTDVVVGGGGGALYVKHQTCRANGTCDPFTSPWENISKDKAGTTVTTTASPDLARYADPRFGGGPYTLLAVRGQNNALWVRVFDGKGWGLWHNFGGTLLGGPGATWVEAQGGGVGMVEVFGVGTDGALWRNTVQCLATTCLANGWTRQGAPPSGRLVGDVDATSRTAGSVDVVARDDRGYARHRVRTGATWSPYVQLAPTLGVYGPTVTSLGNGMLAGSTPGAWATYVEFLRR
ncbi:MAG TPA: hypothetical protein VFX21_07595, partial [Acidimicrobiia bacterium]|nr:hypothetical protein [Acidimicrobiia bacterium]